MNTITEPRHQIPSTEVEGSEGSPQKPGLGQLWLAILAMAAIVGLAVAVAVGAFDSSSDSDGTVKVVDPRADSDSHRPVPAASANQGMDADTQRELNQRASSAVASATALDPRADADSHRTAPAAPVDSDATRELNQQASQSDGTAHYVSGGLSSDEFWEVYGQPANQADPRSDADHHREASN